ncbi:cell wall synthase accessory phosphoprotein MacP [Streptococcus didelphis]|uniref:Cell wall synthase accessory phosphoprotein MacP n=1 Tax=Streptococcus didelphis TaxID=102886 RepID=A0ABY9LI40_9STRE|nr:cell wall synthase accessory phosphoprotein MacP [Streptococcus didelphis]WMB28517.1 cell wall synthase accessory phosphoprotein MacP [Streptococcus didelphis]WMB29193.1 cell wall synthase accessory phosphoprotein MacP [Streptococcus didelphis]
MGKSLLTDDIIEKAQNGEEIEDDFYLDSDTKIIHFSEDKDEERIYKSRRIENAKRHQFQSKLNLLLIALVILIALLIYAIFKL